MGESGGSAERKAEELRASGKLSAGAWAAGAEGERRVAAALQALPDEWLVLHDRLLMPGIAESNIDHLLVGPAGVFLVDAKNWAGQIGEWEGTVFQHSWRADGSRLHRPVDREFAGVVGMAGEVARRTGSGVTQVICLAGRQADQFGEPRVLRNVWVVPVSKLASWLSSRPVVPIRNRTQLDVRVTTEFPSTTTDAALLLAMGRDLGVRRAPINHEAIARLQGYPRPAPRRATSSSPARAPRGRAKRRTGGVLRPLMGLAMAVGLLIAVHNGAFAALMGVVTSRVSDAVAAGGATDISRVSGDSVASAKEAGAAPTRTRLSCEAFDPADHKRLAKMKLTPTETPTGCVWTLPPRKGSALPIRIVRIQEDIRTYGLNPLYNRSTKSKAPEVTRGWSREGWSTHVWVAKGARVTSGGKTVTSKRFVLVAVAYEALGVTEKQGRALGLAIAGTASTRPVPTSP